MAHETFVNDDGRSSKQEAVMGSMCVQLKCVGVEPRAAA
jgi:hypothetical protein